MEYIGKHSAVQIDFGGGCALRTVPASFVSAIKQESEGEYFSTTPRGELFFTRQTVFYVPGGGTEPMPTVNQFGAFTSEVAAIRDAAGGDW